MRGCHVCQLLLPAGSEAGASTARAAGHLLGHQGHVDVLGVPQRRAGIGHVSHQVVQLEEGVAEAQVQQQGLSQHNWVQALHICARGQILQVWPDGPARQPARQGVCCCSWLAAGAPMW